jgi:hypothetical protein
MNVEIRAEAALFPEKEYIKGIFRAVHVATPLFLLVLDLGQSQRVLLSSLFLECGDT